MTGLITHLLVLQSFRLSSYLVPIFDVCVVAAADEVVRYWLVQILIVRVNWSFCRAVLVPPEFQELLERKLIPIRKGPAWLSLVLLDAPDECLESSPRKILLSGPPEIIVHLLEVPLNARGSRWQTCGRETFIEGVGPPPSSSEAGEGVMQR